MKITRPAPLSRTIALVPPAALLVVQHAGATFDTFIKIGDIKGEVTQASHLEWIDGYSFQFGVTNPISPPTGTSGSTPGKPVPSEVVLTKKLDSASPNLFLSCVRGERVPEVKIELVRQDAFDTPRTFYRITLSDVYVSSVSNITSDGQDIVAESISLNYDKIKIEYYKQDEKGAFEKTPISSGWDFANNVKL